MRIVLLFSILLSTAALAQEHENNLSLNASDEFQTLKQGLYTENGAQYGYPRVFVCWEPDTIPDSTTQFWIRDQITKTYEALSSLHFVGWGTCQVEPSSYYYTDPYSSHIRISVADVRPNTYPKVGNLNAGLKNNVTLNNTYVNYDPNCKTYFSLEKCVRWTAVHEFGHALSAWHEQTRPDTPSDCTAWLQSQVNQDYQIVTNNRTIAQASPSWDMRSTMDYCNSGAWAINGKNYGAQYSLIFQNGGNLSSGDVANWGAIYGSNKISYRGQSSFGNYTDGVDFSFVNGNRSSPYQRPDLWMVKWGGSTGSGKIEIYGASSSSNYQSQTVAATTPLGVPAVGGPYIGFTMVQIDSDNSPELVWFYQDTSANRLRMYALSGSSNWQQYALNVILPMEAGNSYKFTFTDYNGDGSQDLFTMRMVNSTQLEISVWQGPSFTNMLARSYVPFDSGQANNCRYVAGNFYNHTTANGGVDLVCMAMNSGQTSTDLRIGAWIAGSNSSNPYTSATSVATPTQWLYEDARYANFGIWNNSATSGSGIFPGDGLKIGYFKRATSEVFFLNSSLYF